MRQVRERRRRLSKEAFDMTPVNKMRVRDSMVTKPVLFTRDMDLLDAVSVLVDRRISGAAVVDERGSLIGVLTERDFLKAALVAGYHGESGGCVGDCMSREVHAVNADDSLLDVATAFAETNYRGFPVIEDNRVVGYITRRHVLRAVLDAFGPRRTGFRRST
jgi:CBS domain-containing protein